MAFWIPNTWTSHLEAPLPDIGADKVVELVKLVNFVNGKEQIANVFVVKLLKNHKLEKDAAIRDELCWKNLKEDNHEDLSSEDDRGYDE